MKTRNAELLLDATTGEPVAPKGAFVYQQLGKRVAIIPVVFVHLASMAGLTWIEK
jgi:hypothetical protein